MHLIKLIGDSLPPSLRQIDPRIPRDLEAIVLRCLAKDPKDRYQSGLELREELDRFVQNRPTRTRPLSPPERLWRWCKRNPLVAGLNALTAALAIVIAVVSTVSAHRNARLASQLEARNRVANEHLATARKNAMRAYISEAEARRVSRRLGQRFDTFAAIDRALGLRPQVEIPPDELMRLRNETISALALPALRVAKELDEPRVHRNGAAIDTAFERYAFKLDDGTVVIRRISDAAELMRFPGLPPVRDHTTAAFSPDGRYLSMTSDGRSVLQVWDLNERRLVLTDQKVAPDNKVNWSFRPDGLELALVHTDGSVVFYELPSGRPLPHRSDYPIFGRILSFSADGSRLAISAKDGST